jgi:hypothetical protein
MLNVANIPALNSSIPAECVHGPGLSQLKQLQMSYGSPQAAWAGAGQESVPLLPDLGRLRSLQRLFVYLWGDATVNVTLPAKWAANDTGLSALTTLSISGPGLVGSLPPEWGTWTGLSAVNDLSLYATRLNGTLPATWPDQLGKVSNFIQMNFEGNQGLAGTIPSEWSRFGGRLHKLNLGQTAVAYTLISCSWSEDTVLGPSWFWEGFWDRKACDNTSPTVGAAGGVITNNSSDTSTGTGECTWQHKTDRITTVGAGN